MSKKKDKFERFLEELPVVFDIVKHLNDNIDSIVEKLKDDQRFPLQDFCNAEEIFDGRQYGAGDEDYIRVWYLTDYKINVMLDYGYTSYDGSFYDDSQFIKVKAVTKQIQVFEEIVDKKKR